MSDHELKGNVELAAKKLSEHSHKKKATFRQWCASIVITISYFIVGTQLGWPSPVLYYVRNYNDPFAMTTGEISLAVSLFYIGCLVMPIPSGYLIDFFGRKYVLIVMSMLAFGSWVLTYLAWCPEMIHAARFLGGMWNGLTQTVVPLYLGEIADPKIRGSLFILTQLSLNIGILFEYVAGPLVSYKLLAGLSAVVPAIFVFSLIFIPESPYWYITKEKYVKAAQSLAWLKGLSTGAETFEEVEKLSKKIKAEKLVDANMKRLFSSQGNRKALIMVEVLAVCQRMSGISAQMAYLSITLPDRDIGILSSSGCAIVIASIWVISGIPVIFLVDRFGRKPLLMVSSIGSGVSTFAALLWYFLQRNTSTEEIVFHWVPFVSFFSYGWFFNVGLGPLPTAIQGEVFPTNLKAFASAITTIVLSISSAFGNGVYLIIAESIGMYFNFLIFTLICVTCALFVQFYLIETTNKSLLTIQAELHIRSRRPSMLQRTTSNPF